MSDNRVVRSYPVIGGDPTIEECPNCGHMCRVVFPVKLLTDSSVIDLRRTIIVCAECDKEDK